LGGYDSHLPLDQHLFLRSCFGQSSWERGSKSIINTLCSFLSPEELEIIEEEYPDLEYSEPSPIDEDRFEVFLETVESFV
jgi:hypothetical protein